MNFIGDECTSFGAKICPLLGTGQLGDNITRGRCELIRGRVNHAIALGKESDG